jgi:hypothetical protein
MAKNLNDVFGAVSQAAKTAGEEESVRSIANSPLVSSIPVGVGSSLLDPSAQNQTTRLFAGSDTAVTGSSQGIRAQVPPATDNKVPRLYGNVTTGGVVVDAVKSGANTIFVAFALSETDPGAYDQYRPSYDTSGNLFFNSWTVNNIYRDNYELDFSGTTS